MQGGSREKIPNLLAQDSAADQHGTKAFACLRELRTGCVRYEEPAGYNTLLYELRSKYAAGAKAPLLHAIRADLMGGKRHVLITSNETEESEVIPPASLSRDSSRCTRL